MKEVTLSDSIMKNIESFKKSVNDQISNAIDEINSQIHENKSELPTAKNQYVSLTLREGHKLGIELIIENEVYQEEDLMEFMKRQGFTYFNYVGNEYLFYIKY